MHINFKKASFSLLLSFIFLFGGPACNIVDTQQTSDMGETQLSSHAVVQHIAGIFAEYRRLSINSEANSSVLANCQVHKQAIFPLLSGELNPLDDQAIFASTGIPVGAKQRDTFDEYLASELVLSIQKLLKTDKQKRTKLFEQEMYRHFINLVSHSDIKATQAHNFAQAFERLPVEWIKEGSS